MRRPLISLRLAGVVVAVDVENKTRRGYRDTLVVRHEAARYERRRVALAAILPYPSGMAADLKTLYRPVGEKEFQLIKASGFHAFPPRLPHQPFFYPVLTEEYATKIARDWNTKDDSSGFAGENRSSQPVRTAHRGKFRAPRVLDSSGRFDQIQCEHCGRNSSRCGVPRERCTAGLKLYTNFRSFELFSEGGELLLNFGKLPAQSRHFFFQHRETVDGRAAPWPDSRGGCRHMGCLTHLRWLAGE